MCGASREHASYLTPSVPLVSMSASIDSFYNLLEYSIAILQSLGSYVVLWKKGQDVLTAGNMIVKPDHRLR